MHSYWYFLYIYIVKFGKYWWKSAHLEDFNPPICALSVHFAPAPMVTFRARPQHLGKMVHQIQTERNRPASKKILDLRQMVRHMEIYSWFKSDSPALCCLAYKLNLFTPDCPTCVCVRVQRKKCPAFKLNSKLRLTMARIKPDSPAYREGHAIKVFKI